MAVVDGLFGKSVKSRNFVFFGNKKKLVLAAILGLGVSFIAIWSTFSSPYSMVYSPMRNFGWIGSGVSQHRDENVRSPPPFLPASSNVDAADSEEEKERIEIGEGSLVGSESGKEKRGSVGIEEKRSEASVGSELEGLEMGGDAEEAEGDDREKRVEEDFGYLFERNGHQNWKLCDGGRTSVQNFIPCIDLERTGSGKLKKHRHQERNCPDEAPMCLIPLPKGYESSIPWPESNDKACFFYFSICLCFV